jgi:hypothetical protein
MINKNILVGIKTFLGAAFADVIEDIYFAAV